MQKITFDISKYSKPTTKATWSGVEVVDYFREHFEIPDTGSYGYSSWLRRVKTAEISIFHAKELISIMKEKERFIRQSTGEQMHRGKWMFNRFRYEIKEKGIDKYISSQK